MNPGNAHTASPQAQLWLATWRHSRLGWIGLAVLTAALSSAAVAMALGRSPSSSDGVGPPLEAVWLFAWFFGAIAGFAGALLGVAWVRLLRGGAFKLQPGSEQVAKRLGVVQACTVWLLPTLALASLFVAQITTDADAIAWPVLTALGLPALAVAMGIAATVFGRTVLWAIQIAFLSSFLVLSALMRNQWLSLSDHTLHVVSMVLGLMGPAVLMVVLKLTFRQLLGAGIHGARPLDLVGLFQHRSGTVPTPIGLRGLWFCGLPATTHGCTGRLLVPLLAFAVMLLAINPSSFPWNGPTACLMVMLGSSGWLGLASSAWASPRVALVPGGWRRAQSSWPMLLQRTSPWFSNREPLVVSLALLLMVAAIWQPPWQQWLALGPGVATVVVISAATTLALLPAVLAPTTRVMTVLGGMLVLAVCLSLMNRYNWPLADEHPLSWLARSTVLLAGAIVLGWVMLAASRRAWERIDWGRQPTLPPMSQWRG